MNEHEDFAFEFLRGLIREMAKANVILLNSILWNLREVTKLAEKIKKHCGDVDCISWRYPLTSCSELEIFKLLQNNRSLDNYTYILELTYDRLLYLFNLFIKYLESVDSLEKFRPSKNVHRPKTLSLASVLHMIWERIQALTECITRMVREEKSEADASEKELCTSELAVSTSSACTQSDLCSISLCSCCEMVQRFVTQLVLEMEKVLRKQDFESAISSEREITREYLMEMTSWSAMSRWLAAILKDFTALSDKMELATTSSRKLRHRLDSGEKKIKQRMEQHEEEKRRLEVRLGECEEKISRLEENMEMLIREKIQLNQELDSKNSELISVNSQLERKMAELKRNYEKKLADKKEKKEKKKKEKEREEELKKMLEAERQKLREEESQSQELKKDIFKLKQELEALNSKSSEDEKSWLKKLHDLEGEIESLKEENLRLNSTLKEKQEKIMDYSMRLMEAFPELNGASKPKFKASGNPEIDMSNQIEANKIRIELLNSENESLQRTLVKIRSLKG